MNRRDFLTAASSSLMAALASPANSAEPLKELRIGYQKIGALLVVKDKKALEQRFEPQGVRVRWIEFAFGPPLLEALGAGAIDYGYTGDSPPIFAQAAHANLLYAGAIPARGYGQAILVPATSSIKGISGLKGKKIAVRQGVERPQPPGRRARKRRSPVERHSRCISRLPTPPPPSSGPQSTPGRSGTDSSRSPSSSKRRARCRSTERSSAQNSSLRSIVLRRQASGRGRRDQWRRRDGDDMVTNTASGRRHSLGERRRISRREPTPSRVESPSGPRERCREQQTVADRFEGLGRIPRRHGPGPPPWKRNT